MPLPLILGLGAAVAGLTGIGTGIHGAVKIKEANDNIKTINSQHQDNIARFKKQQEITTNDMDKLGMKELEIFKSFEKFAEVWEKIKNKPQIKCYNKDEVAIPEYDGEELKQVNVGAGILLGSIGATAGSTAAGIAASGATTSAVMALGTASTGTAISSLSGAAATNATLAALGGGSLAAGGGGMALGSLILGAASFGVGILAGGVIFNITGSSLSNKADEAKEQMEKAEDEINNICFYMKSLSNMVMKYYNEISKVNDIYINHLNRLTYIVEVKGKTDYNTFSNEEKLNTENTVLLVSLLYNMGKVKLVLVSEDETKSNQINTEEIEKSILSAEKFLIEKRLN